LEFIPCSEYIHEITSRNRNPETQTYNGCTTLAFRARKINDIDDLIPGWKDRLIIELQKDAMILKNASDPDHYSTAIHNLAFVHQFLAE
jgi:DNA polymerase II small subunit/DNA polymerase delta subunit B